MRFPSLLVLAVALCVMRVPLASAQSSDTLPLVTTTGSAEIKVVPDLADLSFEVEVRHLDLAAAREEQAGRAVKVLAALRAAGIAEKELDSTQAQITAHYSNLQTDTSTVQFYQVTQGFTCTLHDVSKVADVTAAAVSAGASDVGAVSLRSSESRKHRDEARRKAVVVAREKAVTLATELGAKVGRPHSITETDTPAGGRYQAQSMNVTAASGSTGADTGDTSTFAAGVISLGATVKVSFVLE